MADKKYIYASGGGGAKRKWQPIKLSEKRGGGRA